MQSHLDFSENSSGSVSAPENFFFIFYNKYNDNMLKLAYLEYHGNLLVKIIDEPYLTILFQMIPYTE